MISLTPLIDVVFILLIFFMLASSFLQWRAIDLNSSAQAAAGSSMQGALLVEIRDDGLRLGGITVSLDRLVNDVSAAIEKKPDRRVLIRPAESVSVQEVVSVLDRLAPVAGANISLVRGGSR